MTPRARPCLPSVPPWSPGHTHCHRYLAGLCALASAINCRCCRLILVVCILHCHHMVCPRRLSLLLLPGLCSLPSRNPPLVSLPLGPSSLPLVSPPRHCSFACAPATPRCCDRVVHLRRCHSMACPRRRYRLARPPLSPLEHPISLSE
jgi:hypothetical protein